MGRAPAPTLHLAVQYAGGRGAPSRGQLRRWIGGTLDVASAASGTAVDTATLTVRFVDVDEGELLNRTFRGQDHATNVLTFPLDGGPREVAADIVVCLPVVEREAHEQRKPFAQHCAHLVVHGTLHACGYDHEAADEADAMEDVERLVLRRFRIADPYVAKSEDTR